MQRSNYILRWWLQIGYKNSENTEKINIFRKYDYKKAQNTPFVIQGSPRLIRIGGNILIIDDDFMIQGSSSLEVSQKRSRDSFSNINFDSILTGSGDREQILGALNTFKQIWFNEKVSADYKQELLNSLQYVYKEHSPEFLYYFNLRICESFILYIKIEFPRTFIGISLLKNPRRLLGF